MTPCPASPLMISFPIFYPTGLQFSHLQKRESNSMCFVGFLSGMKDIVDAMQLAQCLTQSKHSVHAYFSVFIVVVILDVYWG